MKIGDRIKQRRMELDWSQRDLANKMGYNHSTITRIETGKIDISQSRVKQFSEVLGVSIAYLMGWEEETPEKIQLNEGEEMLLDLFRRIPVESQPMVLEMIKVVLKQNQ